MCSVRIGKAEYSPSVKEESVLFLIYDVVPLQDLHLVMNIHEQGGRRTQYAQSAVSWEGASIQQNSAELHIITNRAGPCSPRTKTLHIKKKLEWDE